jgi:hypothetical protein
MYLNTGKRTIKKIVNLGEIITLDDGSRWKVSFMDKTKSKMWMMLDDVAVASYVGSKYKITHIRKNETIEATLLD